MRRLFVELPDEKKEKLARENGHDLEYVGLLRKYMCGTMDANARWQAHYGQILKENGFAQGLINPSLFVSLSVCARGTKYSTARSR